MHLLEGPDLGHTMLYQDGKLAKKNRRSKKPSARWDLNSQPHDHKANAQPPCYNRGPVIRQLTCDPQRPCTDLDADFAQQEGLLGAEERHGFESLDPVLPLPLAEVPREVEVDEARGGHQGGREAQDVGGGEE